MTIRHIDLNPTTRCNANCEFCYGRRDDAGDMPDEVAAATWRWLAEHADPKGVSVNWLGSGEPMLRWEWILEQCRAAKELIGIPIKFSVSTNGSIMPQEFIDAFKAVSGTARISIEGPPIDGKLRGLDAGLIEDNVRRMVAAGWTGSRSTIAPNRYGEMVDVAKHAVSLGLRRVVLMPVTEDSVTEEQMQALRWGLQEVTDWYIERLRAGQHVEVRFLERYLNGRGKSPRSKQGRGPGCALGTGLLGVDSTGRFVPCHRYCGSDRYHMGSVFDGLDTTALCEANTLYSCPHTACLAYPGCVEGCPWIREEATGDMGGYGPESWCQYIQICVAEAERACRILSAERNPIYSKTVLRKHKVPFAGPQASAAGVSVVIIAHNEGDMVRETVRNYRRNLGAEAEIVVVDDGSTDGSCGEDMLGPYGATVIRQDEQRGISKSRNTGWKAAKGDVIVFTDAHVRIWKGSVAELARQARDTGRVGMAANTSWDDTHRYTNYGAKFVVRPTGELHIIFLRNVPKVRFEAMQAVNGMCYAVPRSVLERIGGWIDCFTRWGFNEPSLSLKLWFAGVDCFVDRDTLVGHYYKMGDRKLGYPTNRRDVWFNGLAMMRVCFDAPTFWLHWAPRYAKARWTDDYYGRLKRAEPEAAAFQECKVRTDEEFFEEILHEPMPYRLDDAGNVEWIADPAMVQGPRAQAKDYPYIKRTRRLLDWFQERADAEWPEWTALDAGTRDGGALEEMAHRGCARATGIEIVPAAVEHARSKGLTVETGNIEDLHRWPAAHFDFVLCEHVLEHCVNAAAAIAELCRVATRYVLIEVPRETTPDYSVAHLHAFPDAEHIRSLAPAGWTVEGETGRSVVRAVLRRN